jgi:hypothetical protein
MGVFYKTQTRTPALKSAIEAALRLRPDTIPNIDWHATAMAMQAEDQMPKPQFLWGRLGVAVGLLALIGGFGIWSSTVPALDAWSKMFLHGFELILGAVVGLLGAESASKG